MQNKNRCVIVSAGTVSACDAGLICADDFVIACDAGWKNCEKLGITPHMIVGDFDSSAQPQGRQNIIVLPHEKDDTDTHFAARKAKEMGFKEVLLLGALGGKRMEHSLANIGTCLMLEKNGIKASMRNAYSRVSFVQPGETAVYRKSGYFYVSVFPAEGRAEGVSVSGAHYAVNDAVLTADFPVGVSNEYAQNSDTIRISVRSGMLMIVETAEDNAGGEG